MKVTTKIELFTDKDDACITGRLLGLVKEKDMPLLLNSKKFQRKIFSKQTVSISETGEAINKLCKDNDDIRLVLAVKTLDAKSTSTKTLFVSDKLDFVVQASEESGIIVNGKKDTCLFIEED